MVMREFLSLQSKLVPDILHVMQKRLDILRRIYLQQPIGRRSLAASLNTTERILRGEVEFLKEQGLVRVETVGMFLSDQGLAVMESLEGLMKEVFGLSHLETELQQFLGVKRVVVVSGDSEEDELVKKELGRSASQYLMSIILEKEIVAVTGGSTLATMAEMMSENHRFPDVLFVPARGGMGENVEWQANQIAATCAKKVGAGYRMLHVSDILGAPAMQSLLEDPSINEIVTLIRSANVVVHGIGRALEMALRRKAPVDVLKKLEQGGAVGESFGYYFDQEGKIVYHMETMGLQLENVHKARVVIGIAGGKNKAEAIIATSRVGFQDVLIMDEAAAEGVLKRMRR
jgi:central glycolytic genes regulator